MARRSREHSLVMRTEGDRVKARRERVGWDKQPFARRAGVSRATLASIENGQGFNRSSLTKIEKALDEIEEEAGWHPLPELVEVTEVANGVGWIEFEITGANFGTEHLRVKGPVANPEAVGRAVAELLRAYRAEPSEPVEE